MSPILSELVDQICLVIRDCGQQAEHMADKEFEVFEKGPEDYVTTIDASLDQQLQIAFSVLFPNDGVISEENAQSRLHFQKSLARLWCIDPLDGTEDFIHRGRNYAVMVGLLEYYQPIAGWVYGPAQDVMYYGGPDWGVFQAIAGGSATQIPVQEPADFTDQHCPIVIGNRDRQRYGEAIARSIPGSSFSSLGSFGLKVMEVILGRAPLYLYFNGRVKIWDTAGPIALAKAAGLSCCDLEGNPLGFSPDVVEVSTLTHTQPIVIGWPRYLDRWLGNLQDAVQAVES
jgi:3'(2'), 5'-bisphosphate nucleotidase